MTCYIWVQLVNFVMLCDAAKRQRTSTAGSISVGMQQGHPLTAAHQAVSPAMRRSHSSSAEPGQDATVSAPLK